MERSIFAVRLSYVVKSSPATSLTRETRELVKQIEPEAPFAAMALFLFAVGLAASWIPGRRASLVDPIESMRGE